jgi:hypothetical protein
MALLVSFLGSLTISPPTDDGLVPLLEIKVCEKG